MRVGVDYYPEQWDRAFWESDAEAMARTGVKFVRMGESAWYELEPEESMYEMEWLTKAIHAFSKRRIGTVLCIPTDNPPLWMYEKHPEIAGTGADGREVLCINSPDYRDYAKRLAKALVHVFSGNTSVVAWQVGRNTTVSECTCEACCGKFRQWLIEKYGSLEKINKISGARFSRISQISPVRSKKGLWNEPTLRLDWYRFCSSCSVELVHDITTMIRYENPNAIVTASTSSEEISPDYRKLYKLLDVVSFNNYPPVALSENVHSNAFELDLMRGIKGGNFWAMEQLSGSREENGVLTPAPKKGMIMGYGMQAMVRGADLVFHYRWRSPVRGRDVSSQGILGHGSIPNSRLKEFSELCRSADKLRILENTQIAPQAAIIYSPESAAAFGVEPQGEGMSYINHLKEFHRALTGLGANVDVILPHSDLSAYKLVIAPSLYVNNKKTIENLYSYTVNGGTVVLTAGCGVKDECNNFIAETLPTVYKELIGAEVVEYNPIGRETLKIRDFAGNEFACGKWCDILHTVSARAYASYSGGDYDGLPSVTMNRYFKGVAYYVGTICENDFYRDFISNLMMQTGIPRLEGLDDGIEVITRTEGRGEYICFFNSSEKNVSVPLPKPMFSMISEREFSMLELPPFKMEIVRK